MTTSPAPLTSIDLDRLEKLLKKATPGPWEFDGVKTDGCYGNGDDTREGFDEFVVIDAQGRQICSTENRDQGLSEVNDEWDEDSHSAWDELARRDVELIVAAVNTLPALLEAAKQVSELRERVVELEAALAEAEEDRTQNLDRWKNAEDTILELRGEIEERGKSFELVNGQRLVAMDRAEAAEARATALEATVKHLRETYSAERYWEARWRDEFARAEASEREAVGLREALTRLLNPPALAGPPGAIDRAVAQRKADREFALAFISKEPQ